MKRIILNLIDFISILETLRDENDVKNIIITEENGFPAIIDSEDENTIYVFKTIDDVEEEDTVH